jgi:WD40 repeat protein
MSTSVPLSAPQVRAVFDNLVRQYEFLLDNRVKLEADCNKLREYIDSQIQQIQSLNADFDVLHQKYLQRRSELAARAPPEPSPPSPPSPPAAADEPPEQGWMVESLLTQDEVQHPLIISLVGEIEDVSVIASAAFSPDGHSLAIGSNNALRIYNVESDDFSYQYPLEDSKEGRPNHVRSLAWSNDGETIVCGAEDGIIRVISLSGPREVQKFRGGYGGVFQVSVAANNKFFAAVSGDGFLTLFTMPDYFKIAQMTRETDEAVIATSLAISPDDQTIAVG